MSIISKIITFLQSIFGEMRYLPYLCIAIYNMLFWRRLRHGAKKQIKGFPIIVLLLLIMVSRVNDFNEPSLLDFYNMMIEAEDNKVWEIAGNMYNSRAFKNLLEPICTRIYGVQRLDIFQETSLDMVNDFFQNKEKLLTIKVPKAFGSWLAKVYERRLIAYYRKNNRHTSSISVPANEDAETVDVSSCLKSEFDEELEAKKEYTKRSLSAKGSDFSISSKMSMVFSVLENKEDDENLFIFYRALIIGLEEGFVDSVPDKEMAKAISLDENTYKTRKSRMRKKCQDIILSNFEAKFLELPQEYKDLASKFRQHSDMLTAIYERYNILKDKLPCKDAVNRKLLELERKNKIPFEGLDIVCRGIPDAKTLRKIEKQRKKQEEALLEKLVEVLYHY